jgi:hypothetical protein
VSRIIILKGISYLDARIGEYVFKGKEPTIISSGNAKISLLEKSVKNLLGRTTQEFTKLSGISSAKRFVCAVLAITKKDIQ